MEWTKEETISLLTTVKAVKEVLSSEDKWTKGVYAKTAEGHNIVPTSDKAVRWCLAGVFVKVTGVPYNCYFDGVISKLLNVRYFSMVNFNDNHTYEEVIDLLNKSEAYLENAK